MGNNVINTEQVAAACKVIADKATSLEEMTTHYKENVTQSDSAWASSNANIVREKVSSILDNIQQIKRSVESVQARIQVFAKSTENIDNVSFSNDGATGDSVGNISGSAINGINVTQTHL